MSDNPYAPTAKPPGVFKSGQVFDISDADAVRRQHLNHEASIRGIGWLYLLGGVSGSLGGLAYGAIGIGGVLGAVPVVPKERPTFTGLGMILLTLALPLFYAGWTMRKLDPKGKILAIIVSAIGLLGFPCGTLLSGYSLYLLLSAKGEFIYSPQYKEIIAATPYINYRSVLVWLFVGLVVVAIVLVVLVFLSRLIGLS